MMHNTLYVPGHFHATVVTGTTLAFMGMTYLLLPLVFRKEVIWPKAARIQPYLFGIGAAGISLFMMGAGTLGVPRRDWDITASDAILSYDFQGAAYLLLGLNGLSALLASAGGILFVVLALGTVVMGKRVDERTIAAQVSVVSEKRYTEAVSSYGSAGFHHLPGTYILVTVFFTAFVLYYFINWKYLSELWLLG
jgi:cytochrome c oxidase subunit 1